jgi:hypothetical protein
MPDSHEARMTSHDDPADPDKAWLERHYKQAIEENVHLRKLLDLAQELYVTVPIPPLSHVVVRRETAGVDRWAVTDGSVTGLEAWVDGRWQYVGNIGRTAAFRWQLEQALKVAGEAAAFEAQQWRRLAQQGGEEQ